MHLSSYLRSATDIINQYDGATPFARWLKAYFKLNKKFGSKDRKVVSDLCYCYYRLGEVASNKTVEEQLMVGQFLCNPDSIFIKELMPEWSNHSFMSLAERLHFLGIKENNIFPLPNEISEQIDKDLFARSQLIQPDLFLRIRPGKTNSVLQKLQANSVQFSVDDNCIRLANMTKIEEVLQVDGEVVIQDKNSQLVINLLQQVQLPAIFSIWDCCAASGGKTILLHDRFPEARLTVSDLRENILHNLKSRFKRAGIERYQAFVADVSSTAFPSKQKFDLVVCDAPCSGSGTWSRTPEQLRFFPKDKMDAYARLQKAIALNAVKAVKAQGYFLYITCSVFQKENEEVVAYILKETSLQVLKQQYFKGYACKADTLFASLFSL